MATETLHFENARFAQQLFNNEPRNLQSLESELGVKATAREGWIKLEGKADAIERAKNLFASLETMLKAGSQIRNREFTHALNVVKHEGAETLKNLVNDRVTTHEKKPGVTAKTVGQKKYLEGFGPVGDARKTDLAGRAVSAAYAVLIDTTPPLVSVSSGPTSSRIQIPRPCVPTISALSRG